LKDTNLRNLFYSIDRVFTYVILFLHCIVAVKNQMRQSEIIPNYYAYSLKSDGKALTASQKRYFFNCINKIHRKNYKVIYRGEKKSQLQPLYGIEDGHFGSEFRHSLFIMGAKARMFIDTGLPGASEIDIAAADNNEFRLIFRMLGNLLRRKFRFSTTRMAIKGFSANENELTTFFRNYENEQIFVNIIDMIPPPKQIMVRDYYLALLHHISKSEYYSSSFLLSTTTSFQQAHKFAWSKENENSDNPLILFGWVPKHYEGILSVSNLRILKSKINVHKLGLPVYERSFFPAQEEVTLKGGLLPHYLLGYLCNQKKHEVFEINPVLFQTDKSWDGEELPIDQNTFHQRIQNTVFGRFFTVEAGNNLYRQHDI
jgi:hypothetical protein